VRVFDNAGRVVRTIQNGYQAVGRYSARWDGICDSGRRAASGIFFYRLDAPGFHKVIKVAAIGK
jgi:flagellar hook assembly protein FlgD